MPDGVIQKVRVAALSVVGAKYLAPPRPRVLGLFGSGWQAGAHLEFLCSHFPFELVKVFSPNRDHAAEFCKTMSAKLERSIECADWHMMSHKRSELAACEPSVEVKCRRLDLKRRRSIFTKSEINSVIGCRTNRCRNIGNPSDDCAMHVSARNELNTPMARNNCRKIICVV